MHNPPTMGHFGFARTLWRLRQYYHFPREYTRVKGIVNKCPSCTKYTTEIRTRVPLSPYPIPTLPFEVLSADLLGSLPLSISGNRYLLVVCCFLTRYCILVPIKSKEALSVTEALRTCVFAPFSASRVLLTDNGKGI